MLTDTQRKMASVQEIARLSPIENSDFLEVAEMKNLGWKVVVKKGEFKVGDKVVYFEIDSAINVNDLPEPLAFLKDKGTKKLFTGRTPNTSAFSGEYVRIKTIKLRGQVSQGLIVPWDNPIGEWPTHETMWMMDFLKNSDMEFPDDFDGVKPGFDLTKAFHVEVWDRLVEWYEERSQLGPRAQMHSAGDFPADVPKTDEERVQTAYADLVKDPANVDGEWEVTEKNDGSSCTLFYRPQLWPDDPMRISSRRFLLKDDGFSDDWFAAFKKIGWDSIKSRLKMVYEMGLWHFSDDGTNDKLILPHYHELAIQGEMIGAKFNGNRDKNTENHFRVFRIFDITEQKFVTPEVRYLICKIVGLEHVKVIETCKIFQKLKTIDDFIAYADGVTDNGNPREGVVFKRVDDGSVSFKSVSNKYLLKNGD